MECSIQDVRYAIAVVEQTRKRETLRNPEGLFIVCLRINANLTVLVFRFFGKSQTKL